MVAKPAPAENADASRTPYRHAQPKEAFPDLLIPHAIAEDERLWAPERANVWFRPLCLSASQGYWVNLARCAGVASFPGIAMCSQCTDSCSRAAGDISNHDWVATPGCLCLRTRRRDSYAGRRR